MEVCFTKQNSTPLEIDDETNIRYTLNINITNNYSPNFIDSCIDSFVNKLYTSKVIVESIPKRHVAVELLFLGSTLFQIPKKLQKSFSDKLTSCN